MRIIEQYLFKYELPVLAVHISLMIFLVWQRYKKRQFGTEFFTLFIAQGCARYLGYALYVLNRFDWDKRCQAWRTAPFHFALVFIFVEDSAIAFNRFTAIRFPFRHKQIWSKVTLVTAVLGGLAFAVTSAALYWLLSIFITSGEASRVHSITSAVPSATTFLVNISLESYTVVYFAMLNAAQKKTRRGELHLLVYAIIMEMTQFTATMRFVCALAGCTTTRLYGAMHTYLAYCRYLMWFSTAPLLLISSHSGRDAYLKFYRLKRAKVADTGGTM